MKTTDMKIKAKQIEGKGLGVVARAIIPAGLEIECCPITPLTADERMELKRCRGSIGEYPFVDREAYASLPERKRHKCPGFIAWGLMSLANHSFTPNAHVYTEETEDGPVAVLKALRTIYPDEEIEIGYPDVRDYDGDWTVAPEGLADDGAGMAAGQRAVSVLDTSGAEPRFRRIPLKELRDIRPDDGG